MRARRGGHLADIAVFSRSAELGQFAAAAEQLRLPPSSVSRAIQRLEARLGASLFTRTTRRVALTETGAVFFQQVRQALQQIEDAEIAAGGAEARPVGRFRLAVPTTYGHVRILPRLPDFQRRNPGLQLEVHVTNRVIDLVEENFDVVIRLGQQPSSGLIARTLENLPIGTFAAPSYLEARGEPTEPSDLARHVCIGFVYPGSPEPLEWEFMAAGRHHRIAAANGPTIVHDPMGMVTLAVAGGGLIQTGRYVVAEHLAAGRLVEVLESFAGVTRPIVALYPPNRRHSAKLRAFFDAFGRTR
jgi:DNA-binding transcriptional LysR family regulator